MRRCFGALLVSGLLMGSALADGLFYRLPEDGSFARFDLQMKMERGGMEMNAQGSLQMSSVGKTAVNGEDCRWIEIKLVMDMNGKEETVLGKILIPEKHLKAGATPLEHAVKGFLKMPGQQTKELNDFKGNEAGPLPLFLSGPLDDLKKLPKEVIDTGIGKLECEGVTGMKAFEEGPNKINVRLENRLSDKAPFGLASSKMDFKTDGGGGTLTLRLLDVGKDAKSELPD